MHDIVSFIAQYFIAIPLLVLVYVFWKLDKSRRVNLFILLVGSGILTALLVKLATTIHQDPRPFVQSNVVPYFKSSTDNGFPSDHTAFSAVIGFVVLHFRRRTGLLLLVTSLVIGSARVIAHVHHTQDIVGGFLLAILGYAIARLGLKLFQARKHRT